MTQRKSFGSDNHAGVHPAVLRAIVDANSGDALPYGTDAHTEQVAAGLRDVIDWERFDSPHLADAAAKEMMRLRESYRIKEHGADCPKCRELLKEKSPSD